VTVTITRQGGVYVLLHPVELTTWPNTLYCPAADWPAARAALIEALRRDEQNERKSRATPTTPQ
jgi:hypothetical protein